VNTIQIQLNDKQYDAMMGLLDYAQSDLQSDLRNASDEESEAEAKEMLAEHEDLVQELTSTKSYLWSSGCGRVDLDIAAEHVDAIAVSGDNEPACLAAIENDGYLRYQLGEMDMEAAVDYLKEAGIEDVDRKSNDDIRVVLLWIACHDISDESAMET